MREVDDETSTRGDEIQYRAEWRNEQVAGRMDMDFSNVCHLQRNACTLKFTELVLNSLKVC